MYSFIVSMFMKHLAGMLQIVFLNKGFENLRNF